MFKIGDAVVHPAKGAGIVQSLQRMPGLSQKLRYYKIEVIGRRVKTTLMIPVKHAEELGLRPPIAKADLDQVWEILAAPPQTLPDDHKQRYKVLSEKLEKGDVLLSAEIVRDLVGRRKQAGKLNAPAEKIYSKALLLLTGELAVSQDVKLQTAKRQVSRWLNENLDTDI